MIVSISIYCKLMTVRDFSCTNECKMQYSGLRTPEYMMIFGHSESFFNCILPATLSYRVQDRVLSLPSDINVPAIVIPGTVIGKMNAPTGRSFPVNYNSTVLKYCNYILATGGVDYH